MTLFWIVAAAMSAAAAWLMLSRGARAGAVVGEDPALAVHRRQLSEIDDLAERGLLADAERKAAHAEAGRRLLAAAGRTEATSDKGRRIVPVAAAAAPLLALVIYLVVGAPGMGDAPYAQRVKAWRGVDPRMLDAPRIAAVLQAAVADKPDDPDLLRTLAMADMAAGDPVGAMQALRKAVALAPGRAELWVELGEAFMAESDGEIGLDAKAAFGEALKRDPKSEAARYYLARAAIAEGEVEAGLAGWRALMADLSDGSRQSALAAEIAAVARTGRLPERGQAPGPEQIRAMVEGLAARLEASPDDPDGWVRLVRAWSVLGETARRDAALAKARERFKDDPKVLAALREAAR